MAQQPKMPFPGESPTISLAMAAGEKFGFHEEEAKPKKSAPKKAKAKKKSVRKAASPARGAAKAKPRKR